jgi:DNA-binding MarR family transcriptional regulator
MTGLNPGNVNKIIKRASGRQWIHREEGRTASGTKQLSLTQEGRDVLAEFESRCAEASAASLESPAKGDAHTSTVARPLEPEC